MSSYRNRSVKSTIEVEIRNSDVTICRICLRSSDVSNVPFLQIEDDLKTNFQVALKQKILRKDPYRKVCLICSTFLEIIVSFKNAALRASKLLGTGTPVQFDATDEWYKLSDAVEMCKNMLQAYLESIVAVSENIELKQESLSNIEQEEEHHEREFAASTTTVRVETLIKDEPFNYESDSKSASANDDDISDTKFDPCLEHEDRINGAESTADDNDVEFSPASKGRDKRTKPVIKRKSKTPRKKRRLKENAKFRAQLCALCGKRVCGEAVEAHMNQHRGVKPYRCTEPGCTLEFYGSYHRKRHMHRIHNEAGVTAHKCHVCEKMIRGHRGALKEHMRLHDLKERNFVCTICGKGFTLNRYLRQHSMVHSEEFPHACSFCGKRFNNKWAMRTHEKTHQKHVSSSVPIAEFSSNAVQNDDVNWANTDDVQLTNLVVE